MARKVFYSFHYQPDSWRVSTVRNIGAIEGNKPASDNDWETVTKGGDKAIEKWINDQLSGRSCTIVLIGRNTAGRKWINYEIKKSFSEGKGLLGVHIHHLKDQNGEQTTKGKNPFESFTYGADKKPLTNVAKAYDPPYTTSANVYDYIKNNIESWIETAVSARNSA